MLLPRAGTRLPCLALPCLALPCLALPCLAFLTLPHLTLPHFTLPYLTPPLTSPRLTSPYLQQTNATQLDELLARNPIPDVEFHCFTSTALPATKSRQLQSHAKQRKLFQDLFAKCTGVIVSAGNETIWEAVCRGVPVLTIPTANHGEQLLNAAVHARNFPQVTSPRMAWPWHGVE